MLAHFWDDYANSNQLSSDLSWNRYNLPRSIDLAELKVGKSVDLAKESSW